MLFTALVHRITRQLCSVHQHLHRTQCFMLYALGWTATAIVNLAKLYFFIHERVGLLIQSLKMGIKLFKPVRLHVRRYGAIQWFISRVLTGYLLILSHTNGHFTVSLFPNLTKTFSKSLWTYSRPIILHLTVFILLLLLYDARTIWPSQTDSLSLRCFEQQEKKMDYGFKGRKAKMAHFRQRMNWRVALIKE